MGAVVSIDLEYAVLSEVSIDLTHGQCNHVSAHAFFPAASVLDLLSSQTTHLNIVCIYIYTYVDAKANIQKTVLHIGMCVCVTTRWFTRACINVC